VPETMKHAFMDAAAERLICCVACMRMYVCLEINTCSAAMDQTTRTQKTRAPGAHHHMHTMGIGSLSSMLTLGGWT
jgi:hypothetical protein